MSQICPMFVPFHSQAVGHYGLFSALTHPIEFCHVNFVFVGAYVFVVFHGPNETMASEEHSFADISLSLFYQDELLLTGLWRDAQEPRPRQVNTSPLTTEATLHLASRTTTSLPSPMTVALEEERREPGGYKAA